jgi:glycosyltransferase involved in cell wall biosynthesis
MDNKPLVSILIPNYNKAPYLPETLDSVLAQTYTNWECIIVDDLSTDESWEILKEYGLKDSRFKIFKRPKQLSKGGNVCRNYAFSQSNGKYLLFLDSDDLIDCECLENRIKVYHNKSNYDFIVFNVELFKENPGDLKLLWNIDTQENDVERFLKTDGVWQTSGPIYSSEFFKRTQGFDESLQIWQDYEFHFRSILLTRNYLKKLDLKPDVFVRQSGESLSNRQNYFGKKKNLIQRCIIYLNLIESYSCLRHYKYGRIIASTFFLLSSDFFVKYGNWKWFLKFWNLAFKHRIISFFQYYLGLYFCVCLRLSNRKSFFKKLIFNFNGFLNLNLVNKNTMMKISRADG